jgi:hypothetical protein
MKVAVEHSVEFVAVRHVAATLLAPFKYLEIDRGHIH